jgi:predicted HTH transcriptional regulator
MALDKYHVFEEVFHGVRVTLSKEKVTVTDKVTDTLTENQNAIVSLIMENNQITTKALADKIHMSQRKVKENLRKLKDKGVVG